MAARFERRERLRVGTSPRRADELTTKRTRLAVMIVFYPSSTDYLGTMALWTHTRPNSASSRSRTRFHGHRIPNRHRIECSLKPEMAEWARGEYKATLALHRDEAPPRLALQFYNGESEHPEALQIGFCRRTL